MKQESVSKEEVQASILEEIEASLSESSTTALKDLEALLSPIYASLPKNKHGGLGHATVRYALHRLFVQRHGWYINGLDPAGSLWNSSSPASVLKNQVPKYIQKYFEDKLGVHGFTLHDLAVFGATIEHLIHTEAVKHLGSAMRLHGSLPTATLSVEESDMVLDTYIAAYILGENLENMTALEASHLSMQMPDMYSSWAEAQQMVRSARRQMTPSDASQLDFALLTKIAKKVSEQFGQFQNKDCKRLKAVLASHEEKGGTGRVRLSEFYKPAISGDWQFHESVQYLRELGALDESDPTHTRVIIANYVNSRSNCIASSPFYSVCCVNECESLLAFLEKRILAPQAHPEEIRALVSILPSSSVQAPRNISQTLHRRLNGIAQAHAGRVLLHSRLFAQWMHHAFPRECPYPHLAGIVRLRAPEDIANIEVSEEELQKYISANESAMEEESAPLPWSMEDELISYLPAKQRTNTLSRPAVLVLAVMSGALGLIGMIEKGRQFPKVHNGFNV